MREIIEAISHSLVISNLFDHLDIKEMGAAFAINNAILCQEYSALLNHSLDKNIDSP